MYYNSLTSTGSISKAAAVHHNWHSENRNESPLYGPPRVLIDASVHRETCSVIYAAMRGEISQHNTIFCLTVMPMIAVICFSADSRYFSLYIYVWKYAMGDLKKKKERERESSFPTICLSCTISKQQLTEAVTWLQKPFRRQKKKRLWKLISFPYDTEQADKSPTHRKSCNLCYALCLYKGCHVTTLVTKTFHTVETALTLKLQQARFILKIHQALSYKLIQRHLCHSLTIK